MATARITKTQVTTIRECLAAGIPLELSGRKFTSGQITEDVRGNMLRTTHRTPDMMDFIWVRAAAVKALAHQAADKIARKDDILADMAAARAAFQDR